MHGPVGRKVEKWKDGRPESGSMVHFFPLEWKLRSC